MVRGMKWTHLLVVGVAAGAMMLGGCAHHTRRSPELTVRSAAPAKPQGKGVLRRTGDAAWGVVSAPVRLFVPGKKPAVKKEEPVTYEPAEAVIMMPPDSLGAGGAATRPGQ
jgi:hypothetical protein